MLNDIIDAREVPLGLGVNGTVISIPVSIKLPHEANLRGYELRLVSLERGRGDPYVLYDRWGHIVCQWPEGYVPTWMDIREAVSNEHGEIKNVGGRQ